MGSAIRRCSVKFPTGGLNHSSGYIRAIRSVESVQNGECLGTRGNRRRGTKHNQDEDPFRYAEFPHGVPFSAPRLDYSTGTSPAKPQKEHLALSQIPCQDKSDRGSPLRHLSSEKGSVIQTSVTARYCIANISYTSTKSHPLRLGQSV